MSDSKNPTVSEIRRSLQWSTLTEMEACQHIDYLLDLVERMGKSLNWFVHLAHGVGKAGNEPEPREEESAAEEARALLKELKQ